MKLLGWLGVVLVGAGVFGLVGFVGFYDISVPTEVADGPKRVVNLGLMHERNMGVALSLAAVVIGGALVGLSHVAVTRSERPRCPYCREIIEELAVVCPHCRREQPRGAMRLVNDSSMPVKDQVDEWYRDRGDGAV
jgi:hypothetical protein